MLTWGGTSAVPVTARKEPYVESPPHLQDSHRLHREHLPLPPVAERLLQTGLNQVSPGSFEVRSAGTRAMVGEPIQPPLSARIISTFRGNPDGFAARQLTPPRSSRKPTWCWP